MMKCYRQLYQSLEMPSEMAVVGSLAPHVFEDLMGVKEMGGVEMSQAPSHAAVVHSLQHRE
jgi:hypothetical protein